MEDLKTVLQKLENLNTISKLRIGAILFVGLAVSIAVVFIFQASKHTQPAFDYSQFDRIAEQNKVLDKKITELQQEIPRINSRIDARNLADQSVLNGIQNIDKKLSKIQTNEKNTSVYQLGPDSLRRAYATIRQYLDSN